MASVQFEVRSAVPADAVLDALIDFSERRPQLWPAIDPSVYRVHEVSTSSALVTEGSAVMGGIWATELYEWDRSSGAVRATVQESNFWHPGGTWSLIAASRRDGGSLLTVSRDRRAKNAKALLLELMMGLVGARVLAKDLARAPAISGRLASP